MAYVRKPDEILGIDFIEALSEGEIELEDYPVPEVFKPLNTSMSHKYGFTNELRPESCLVLAESEGLTAILAQTQLPELYLDKRLSPKTIDLLSRRCGGIVLKGTDINDHYQTIADKVAQSQGPSVLYVNMFEWYNPDLQRTLIEKRKHFSIALPDVDKADPAPSHYDHR